MCINTHCTPIKFSKYYPTTNGKAGGQTTKKVKEPIFVRVRFPVFILMCLSDAFVVKCDKISIEARIKETVRECLDEGILYEFLKKNGGDIMDFINIELTREECEAIRENDGYERGLQEGINKGIDQGKLREQQAIAKRMKSRDMDITEISDITGLSTDEIEKL